MQTPESSPGSRRARRTAGGCLLGWVLAIIALQALLKLPAVAQSVLVYDPSTGGYRRDESATRAVRVMEERQRRDSNGVREWFMAMYEAQDAAGITNKPNASTGDFAPVSEAPTPKASRPGLRGPRPAGEPARPLGSSRLRKDMK